MTAELLALADGHGTSEPHLSAILRCQAYNQAMGGAVLAPWEVSDLPGEWMEVLDAMVYRLPGMAAGRRKVQEAVERVKKERKWYH